MAGALAPAIGARADQPHVNGQVANGGLRVRLLEAPQVRRNDPRARIYIVDHLAPGTTITRRIGVANESTGPLHSRLYVGAAAIAGGTFQPQDQPNDLGSWSRFGPSQLDIRPGAEATATLTIAVPASATAGERYGVAWAELPGSTAEGVTSVNRVGIRIYLSVGAGGEPASDFVIDTMTAKRNADGTPVVTAQVTNTGARALDLSGSLRLAGGPAGLNAGPFPAKLGTTLAIGDSEPVEVVLDKQIPDGPWEATLDLRSGTAQRSAVARILFPKPGETGPAVPAEPPAQRKVAGVAALGFGVILLVLLFLFFLIFRRRRKEEDEEERELARPSRR
jgi:hypothetical protein